MISSTKSLDALFNEIGKELNDKITMYVFGGAALMFSGLKNATKDIDIVFETRRELKLFIDALKRQGFDTTKITEEYKHLKLQGIYTRKNDRFDVFLKTICNNLTLSKGIVSRAKKKKADYLSDKKELISYFLIPKTTQNSFFQHECLLI